MSDVVRISSFSDDSVQIDRVTDDMGNVRYVYTFADSPDFTHFVSESDVDKYVWAFSLIALDKRHPAKGFA